MSTSSVIQQHIAAFNERDEASEPWAEDAHMIAPGGANPVGREEVLQFLQIFHNAFSDGRLTVNTLLADGGRGAVEGSFDGTHDGPLATPDGDVPATGRNVSFAWAALYEVDGDILRSEHLFFDQAGFVAQLGLG